jgi:hypothetical protein
MDKNINEMTHHLRKTLKESLNDKLMYTDNKFMHTYHPIQSTIFGDSLNIFIRISAEQKPFKFETCKSCTFNLSCLIIQKEPVEAKEAECACIKR